MCERANSCEYESFQRHFADGAHDLSHSVLLSELNGSARLKTRRRWPVVGAKILSEKYVWLCYVIFYRAGGGLDS
jgi:hypothetical protein